MNDLLKALIQAGGAIGALGFIWLIIKALAPLLARRNGNGSGSPSPKSGEQSIDFWKNTIREAVKEGMEMEFKARNETIRAIMRDELKRR